MPTLNLEIVTLDYVFFKGEVEAVKLKGLDGYFEILPRHADYIATVMPEAITIKTSQGNKYAFISKGVIKVQGDNATIIVNTAEWPHEIDIERAEEAEQRAREQLREGRVSNEAKVEMALQRALARKKTFGFRK